MAFLVECDVEGCNSVAYCEDRDGEVTPPVGWRTEQFDKEVPRAPDASTKMAAAMFPVIGSIVEAMEREVQAVSCSIHVCSAHPMWELKKRGEALSIEQFEKLSGEIGFGKSAEPPAWVADVLKEKP